MEGMLMITLTELIQFTCVLIGFEFFFYRKKKKKKKKKKPATWRLFEQLVIQWANRLSVAPFYKLVIPYLY